MKKRILCIMVISSFMLLCACSTQESTQDISKMYNEAVLDAMVAEKSEVQDLVELNTEDKMTTWNDGKVLLLTWNKYPDSYPKDATVELEYGSIWTFTDKELLAWYQETKGEVEDYHLRLNQLIGLPPEDDNTHFTALWVNPDDIIRPAYFVDINSDEMDITNANMDEEYKEWFDGNIISSYYSDWKYPWTRLGYTYDWSGKDDEYGLSEFLVKGNSKVEVEFTMTTEEFISDMESKL